MNWDTLQNFSRVLEDRTGSLLTVPINVLCCLCTVNSIWCSCKGGTHGLFPVPSCSKLLLLRRVPSPGMWRCVDLVWVDVSVCSHLLTLVPRSRIILPCRWRRYIPPKSRFTQDLHSSTSQKTAFFIVTAVKTSNRTCCCYFQHISFSVERSVYC
jgi:hypothetical protein